MKKILNKYGKILIFLLILFFIFVLSLCVIYKIYYAPENNKIINIVFNTDAGYTEYTKVAIKSAIMNKNPKSVYKINILCVDLPKSKMEEFARFKTENVDIKTIPLKLETISKIGNYPMEHYVTRADLFKFLLPDIFPNLDKILYIDGDTIILKDLSPLYNTNIRRYYIAAVKRFDFVMSWVKNSNGFWDLKRDYTYNCGVLLYNLNKWRKDNIKQKLIEAKNKDKIRDLVTQRSFNEVLPIDEIKQISPIYNYAARITSQDFVIRDFIEIYKPYCNKMNTLDDLLKEVVIIHYAGHNKPWSYPDTHLADRWWSYAKLVNPVWQVEKDNTRRKK